MSAVSHCPCCGHEIDANRLLVDLHTNTATRNGITVHLSPRLSEILVILHSAWPGTVEHGTLLNRLYGADGGPEETATIKVHISQLRKAVHSLGVAIVPVWRVGYRLEVDAAAQAGPRRRGASPRWEPDEVRRLDRMIYRDGLSTAEAAARLGRSLAGRWRRRRRSQ